MCVWVCVLVFVFVLYMSVKMCLTFVVQISVGGISIKFLVCLEMPIQTRSRRHIGI